MGSLRRLLKYLRNRRKTVITASVYTVANQLFDIAPEVLIGVAVDVVVNQQNSVIARFGVPGTMNQILVLSLITLVIWVCESLFQYLYSMKWRNLAQEVQHSLRLDAYRHIQQLDISYFEDRSTGGLLSILNDDINQLERFLDNGASALIQVITCVVVIGGIFFYLAPLVALMAMVPIPFIILGAFYYQKRAQPLYAEVREKAGLLGARLANNISGVATIKSFTAEQHEVRQIEGDSLAYCGANAKAIAVSSAFIPIIRMAIMAGFILTLVLGGWLTLQGRLAVGSYSALIFMTQRLLWPLTRLAETVDLYQRAMASVDRVLNLLETKPSVTSVGLSLPVSEIKGTLELRNVSFNYANRVPVLKDISLVIPAGTNVAFVGATGAGKSTLTKLFLRFYDPTQGEILLDGRDVRKIQVADLRRAIGFVSQDVFLFHGSVLENIRYGSFDAPMSEVIAAAKVAEAHDFITALPQGYDTIVGERGQKLSGGQRQRISIARAILKDPPIVILDEATSSVDNETEAAIQRSLEKITVDRTTIVIAHRLSTIRKADQIYVLNRGVIAESGTSEELVEQNGLYAALWRVQTGLGGDAGVSTT